MNRQISISVPVLILAGALVVALAAVAVLVTLLVNGTNSVSVAAVEATATPALPNPSPTSTLAPTVATATTASSANLSAIPTQTPVTATPTLTASPPTPLPPTPTPEGPPPTPTPAPRYASVDLRPDWARYVSARAALDARGVATYQQALNDPGWYDMADNTMNLLNTLGSNAGDLPYDDTCRRTLRDFGSTGFFLYLGLMQSIRSVPPFNNQPTGQTGWNNALYNYLGQFNAYGSRIHSDCGY